MARPILTLEFDTPEPRTLRERLVASADGTSWLLREPGGSDTDNNTLLSTKTKTLMLRPLPFTGEWSDHFTGDYARLTKADYTLITPSKWTENPIDDNGDIYLESLGVNEVVTTTATYPQNQPFYISVYPHGVKTTKVIILECGWGTPGVDGVALRVSADGNVEVWKDGIYLKSYDLGSASDFADPTTSAKGSTKLKDSFVDFVLIPCRARDLLIMSSITAEVNHTFVDLSADNTVQEITPAGAPFWWFVPSGKASVQCAPCHFEEVGVAFGQVTKLLYPPPTGTVFTDTDAHHGAGYGTQSVTYDLLDPATLTAFVADGVKDEVIIRANLGGDGDSTPFVYAVDFVAPRVATNTVNDPFDMTPYITSLKLDVPEGDDGATLTFGAVDINRLESAGLNRPGFLGDRPVRLMMTTEIDGDPFDVDIFRGTAAKPDIVRGEGDAATNENSTTIEWGAADRTAQFDLYRFRSTLPYDGLSLISTVLDLVKLPGFDTDDLDITNDTFVLPFSPGVAKGDWKVLPKRGDSVSDILGNIHSDYAETWQVGWAPTNMPTRDVPVKYRYQWKRPDDLPQEPEITLYFSSDEARADGVDGSLIGERVVYHVREFPEEAEANQVDVVGYDPGTQKYITSSYSDTGSQTPGTAVASRPLNWRGQIVASQLLDPSITTQEAADQACDIYADRVTTGREIVEFDCEFLCKDDGMPIWKGSVIRVKRTADLLYGWFRVLSFSVTSKSEIDGFEKRDATYRCVQIPDEEEE